MKHLRFQELLLMSKQEKACRRIKFDQNVTVIKGENDTGKSSVMKSIYSALGAETPNVDQQWKNAKVISSLKFSVAEESFRIIRDENRFSIFDENDEIVHVFGSVTKELSPYFAELFDFHLPLRSRTEDTQATPAYLFLPFYIDQDQGWQKTLNSFSRLGQFSNWRNDVVSFHAGIRPSEYYLAKTKLREIQDNAASLRQERASLQLVLDGVRKRLEAVDFDIDIDAFKKEIADLLERCFELRKKEYKIRQQLSDAFNAKKVVEEQIEIVSAALAELRADRQFATDLEGDTIVCPSCHATYENNFAERFDIATDEDNCIQLLSELQEQSRDLSAKWSSLQASATDAADSKESMERLLSKKRRKVKLRDVLRREGQRDVSEAIRQDLDSINQRVGELEEEGEKVEKQMKAFEQPKRRKRIRDSHKSVMSKLIRKLDVDNIPEKSYSRLDAQINETGSDLPRGILAYYIALTRTIESHGSSTLCPFVIDSPRQQDQDDTNWLKMLEVIRDERPETQLILALIDDMEVDFGGKTVQLRKKRKVLAKRNFDRAMDELRPLLDASLGL